MKIPLQHSLSILALAALLRPLAAAPLDEATRRLAHDIFQQLIEINTTDSVGSITVAAKAMAKRFLDAGFPAEDVNCSARMIAKKTWWCAFTGAVAQADPPHRPSRRG